ncbi:uncharacterized protein [Periplaneta americana]|uniref:uncharacterized protein n=1 Tax=Periplaneta americana TaxID=6978 RepID=UPI0037E71983
MMLDTATQTSSSDHFEESSRRYAEWEEEVRLEELQHLQRVAIRLFDFSMYSGSVQTNSLINIRTAVETENTKYWHTFINNDYEDDVDIPHLEELPSVDAGP